MIDQKLSVLIIEDNSALAANIYEYLEARGHRPDAAPDGESGLGLLAGHRYDVVVLDWMMPRLDGMTMLERLRKELKSNVPVIVITAKDQLENKLQGFMTGADDYVVKPVALAELEMRFQVVVRRTRAAQSPSHALEVADLRFDLRTLEVTRGGRPLTMTPVRRQLLECLMRQSPNVVRREKLERLIWAEDVPDGDILRSHMHMLRKSVDVDGSQKLIRTIAGVGYRLCASDD